MLRKVIRSDSATGNRNRHQLRQGHAQCARANKLTALAADQFWPARHRILRLAASAVLVLLLPLWGATQSHSGFPVDIIAGPAPQPVVADGHVRLVYELHLTNVAPIPIELLSLDVLADGVSTNTGASTMASYRGEALKKLLAPVEKLLISIEPSGDADKVQLIDGGHSVVLFLDLTLPAGTRPALAASP